MPSSTRRAFALGLALSLATVGAGFASDYPTRPIRMVIAFPPGGSADINGRVVAQQLAKELGGTIIVENKGGAGGNLGAVETKRATPDGYTIFYATSAVVLAPSVYANPGFDPYADFLPISLTATIPLVLVANPKLPAATVKELADWAKTQKDAVNFASSGRGAILHLAGELFVKELGIKATHVAYRGSAPAVTDLLGGSVQFMFLPANEAVGQAESGMLRALAVTHPERLPQLPNVPTIREATGLTTLDVGAWQGLLVPKGVPDDVRSKLTAALGRTLAHADSRLRITKLGSIMLGGDAKDYESYMRQEGARWAKVVAETGAKAE